MKRLTVLWALVLFTLLEANGQMVKGLVKDAETKDPLPFATINFAGTSIGTVSNNDGYFELNIPASCVGKDVQISYMGYASAVMPVRSDSDSPKTILLKPATLTLAELVFRPLSPEDYIRRVVKNMGKSLPKEPFSSMSYYREKFLENGGYLAFTEGVFKSYYTSYQDTIPNQYQLVLYETAENPQEVQFMKSTFDKKDDRRKRRAQKKGEEIEAGDESGIGIIEGTFSGPDEILSMDLSKKLEPFLDSTQFKKFKYRFDDPVIYQGRELLVINFQSKGTVDHLKTKGRIYIDLQSDAFASIDYTGKFVIPFAIEPVLLAFGLTVSNPNITKTLRYQYLNGAWYPEYFHIDVDLELTKIHFFEKNEKSLFEIKQVLKVSDIRENSEEQIPAAKRLDPKKNPEGQVFNDDNARWADFNRLADEAYTRM